MSKKVNFQIVPHQSHKPSDFSKTYVWKLRAICALVWSKSFYSSCN
jgi:hypothetical protein